MDDRTYYKSNDGFGGGTTASFGWLIILLIFIVVLGALFGWGRRDGFDGGSHNFLGDRFRGGDVEGCCGPSKWWIDKDIRDEGCKTREAEQCNTDKVLAQNAKYHDEALRDKVDELRDEVNSLKLEKNFDAKFAALGAEVAGGFCKVNRELDHLECKLPELPKFSALVSTCEQTILPYERSFVREGRERCER